MITRETLLEQTVIECASDLAYDLLSWCPNYDDEIIDYPEYKTLEEAKAGLLDAVSKADESDDKGELAVIKSDAFMEQGSIDLAISIFRMIPEKERSQKEEDAYMLLDLVRKVFADYAENVDIQYLRRV